MLVLDENLPAGQRQRLRKWRLRFRAVGLEVARAGIKDDNLIPVLHRLPQPTFFTLDRHFYRPNWRHAQYGLVWLDVPNQQAAEFIRRFVRHRLFNTQAKRMGVVARVHEGGVEFWRTGKAIKETAPWLDD